MFFAMWWPPIEEFEPSEEEEFDHWWLLAECSEWRGSSQVAVYCSLVDEYTWFVIGLSSFCRPCL